MATEARLLLSDSDQFNLALHLKRDGQFGVKESRREFIKLKSDRESPHYLDIRPGITSPQNRRILGQYMLKLACSRSSGRLMGRNYDIDYDHFAGAPEAMTSYVATMADLSGMTLLQPRVNNDKLIGNKTPLLGKYRTGEAVALFDDVVTDGATKIETIHAISAAGLVAADYFVVLDREEGGAPQVEAATGIAVIPALGLTSMVRLLRSEAEISAQQFGHVAKYIEQYGEPHAKELINMPL